MCDVGDILLFITLPFRFYFGVHPVESNSESKKHNYNMSAMEHDTNILIECSSITTHFLFVWHSKNGAIKMGMAAAVKIHTVN